MANGAGCAHRPRQTCRRRERPLVLSRQDRDRALLCRPFPVPGRRTVRHDDARRRGRHGTVGRAILASRRKRAPHSSFTPVASTTGPHLPCSACTRAANSSGAVGEGAAFWLSNCFFSSADVSAETLARRSVSSTSAGVRAGATSPYQLSELTAA